jgi:hypothetical protein
MNSPKLSVVGGRIYTDWHQVTRRWLMPMYQLAFRWTGNADDSEDVSLRALREGLWASPLPAALPSVDGVMSRVAVRALGRHWLERYGIREAGRDIAVRARDAPDRATPGLGELSQDLCELPRLVLVLRFVRRRSVASIAAQVGESPESTRDALFEGLGTVACTLGLADESPSEKQRCAVEHFVDALVAGMPPRRNQVVAPAWPAVAAAAHIQAAITGNNLARPEFIRLAEEGFEPAFEQRCNATA